MRSYIPININITFMHISRFILVSKSTSFTFLHGRFVYIHTFFHYKMMCGCRLRTCLYDILQTSYERRLYHSHVAPSVPIWAEFYTHHRQDMPIANSSRYEPAKPPYPFAPREPIIYMHIFAGENNDVVIRTRAHEKIQVDFFAPIHYMYCILLGKM